MPERHPFPPTPALARVLEEAEDIARATQQRPSSAHVLLAFFTSRNQAERLLRDRGIDEDKVLALVDPRTKEAKDVLGDILQRAAQVTAGCGARQVDCLHVLVAMTRVRDALAFDLLEALGEKLPALRTRALTILTGAVPRWAGGATESVVVGEEALVSSRPSMAKARSSRPPQSVFSWTPPLLVGPASRVRRDPSPLERRRHEDAEVSRSERPTDRMPPLLEAKASKSEAKPKPQKLPEAAPKIELKSAPKIEAKPAPKIEPKVEPKIEPKVEPKIEPKVEPKPALRIDDATLAKPWLLPKEHYPWLTSLGRNLTAEAARGQLDRVIGREKEIEALLEILGKRRANNPCLIGEPGVGKTAVVEGLAMRLVSMGADDRMGRRILVSLDVGALLVGTHLRGSFNEKLQGLKEEVERSSGRVIVFFDELHTLVGAGSTGDGPLDAANELKGALARGDFPVIGATTFDEYAQHIESDAALKRRFVPVLVKEPSPEQTMQILMRSLPAYAEHHGVGYAPEAVEAAVRLSVRYLTERHLPDKAIALLDLAGSRAARMQQNIVDRALVAQLVAERVDLPVERLLASDTQRLLELEHLLHREVVGQHDALARIAEVIRRNAAGFRAERPQGVFLLVGPTGVGKTETAKALAKILHGAEDALLRFDLSEYAEAHAVARLVGAPPGYVGHDAGGQLTEAVRKRPGRVILFDEIEKAHRDVLQLLLQVLDEGRLTDSHGRTVSFSESIIVLTSNLGAEVAHKKKLGFAETAGRVWEEGILARAKERLSPELWGRIEEKLVYLPLNRAEARQIAELLAADSARRLERERGIRYRLDDLALDYLLDQGGYDASLGARPLRQVLARIVEAPIAARILEGRLHADEDVLVSTRPNGGLIFLVGDEHTSLSQRPMRLYSGRPSEHS